MKIAMRTLKEIESKSAEERWAYFQNILSPCIRCYACRNACPHCYCQECFVDTSGPQWVGKSIDPNDVFTFHLFRAFHMAGEMHRLRLLRTGLPRRHPDAYAHQEAGKRKCWIDGITKWERIRRFHRLWPCTSRTIRRNSSSRERLRKG